VRVKLVASAPTAKRSADTISCLKFARTLGQTTLAGGDYRAPHCHPSNGPPDAMKRQALVDVDAAKIAKNRVGRGIAKELAGYAVEKGKPLVVPAK
jgi:hypothetical protein